MTDVERDHARRAPPEQDVGESSSRSPDIQVAASSGVDTEHMEGVSELHPAAADVWMIG